MRLYRPERLDARAFVRAEAGLLAAAEAGEAGLLVAPLAGEAVLLGRHQRGDAGAGAAWRLGGGRAAFAGHGTVGVALALPRADALSPGDRFGAERVVNRHVRGLLRGLARLGAAARYLGRDSVRVGPRDVALVSQDGASEGAVLFEAIVGAERAAVPEAAQADARWAALGAPVAQVVDAVIFGYANVIGEALDSADALPQGPAPVGPRAGRYVGRAVAIGWLEASVQLEAGRIASASFAGELIAPASWLSAVEASLLGRAPTEGDVRAAILGCLERADAALLGVLPEELALAALDAAAEQT